MKEAAEIKQIKINNIKIENNETVTRMNGKRGRGKA